MPESPHRLDQEMNARRLELGKNGMSWREVAAAANISYETLRAVRQGLNEPTEQTKRGLETALQWAPGSIDSILAGGEPAPLPEPSGDGRGPSPDDPRRRALDAIMETLSPREQEEFLRDQSERLRREREEARAPHEHRRAM